MTFYFKEKNIKIITQKIIVICFFIAIFTPMVKLIFSPLSSYSDSEKRALASFPALPDSWEKISEFPREFEKFFNDHFGFREILINRYQREMKKRFGKIISPKAIEGEKGWLFFTGDNVTKNFRGEIPLNELEIQTFINSCQHKKDWLAQKNIPYLLVMVPNKQSIYPEYLPESLQVMKGQTRYEQMIEHFKGKLPDYYLDLYKPLFKAKQQYQIYSKSDTHWNSLGAKHGYEIILERIRKSTSKKHLQPVFTFSGKWEENSIDGDLAVMLGMADKFKEKHPRLETSKKCAAYSDFTYKINNISKNPIAKPFITKCHEAELKAVIFRDSFFSVLEPMLSENCKQAIYIWDRFSEETMSVILQDFKPDIVIEERVERFLFR
jgi:alginate O-acetyltransferase complex protein AlgJ